MPEENLTNIHSKFHMSEQEFETLSDLMKCKIKENDELKYESLEGYELPPRSQFAMQKKPSITLKGNKMSFSMAAVRMFPDHHYVIPMINAKTKRLSIIPCTDEDNATVEWSRIQPSTGKLQNKPITSEEFIRKIFKYMNWQPDCRYKVIGRMAYSEHGMILVFELEEAIMFASKKQLIFDPISGKTKNKIPKYYPDRYKDCFGISYNDYMAAKEAEQFEDINRYESIEESLDPNVERGRKETIVSSETIEVAAESISNNSEEYELKHPNPVQTIQEAAPNEGAERAVQAG